MNTTTPALVNEPVVTLSEDEVSTEQIGDALRQSTQQIEDGAWKANGQNQQNYQNN